MRKSVNKFRLDFQNWRQNCIKNKCEICVRNNSNISEKYFRNVHHFKKFPVTSKLKNIHSIPTYIFCGPL